MMTDQPAKRTFFYGWIIVAIAFISLAVAYALRYSFTVLSVAIEEEFGWSRAGIHFAFSIIIAVYGFSGPVTGALLDRYGPRKLFPGGALLLGVGLIGCSWMTRLWHLYFFSGLAAIGMASLGMVCYGTLVSNWFVRKRGTAWGLAASGTGFGMFVIVGFFVPWIIEQYGFRWAYVILGVLGIGIIFPLTTLFLRHWPHDIGLAPDGDPPVLREEDQEAMGWKERKGKIEKLDRAVVDPTWVETEWTLARAARTFRFWMLLASLFFFALSLYGVMMHQVQHAVDVGFDKTMASSAFGIVGLLGMIGKFGWGVLSDRIGREITYILGVLSNVVAISIFLSLSDPSQVWILYGFAIFFGLGYGIAQPVTTAIIADLFQGKSLGVIMGFIVSGAAIGGAIGPVFSGYVFDVTGSYRIAFLTAIVNVCLSGVFAWLAAPRKVRLVAGKARAIRAKLERATASPQSSS